MYPPPRYSGNKISSFKGLQDGRRRKIFITKDFDAESRQKRTYVDSSPLATDSPQNEMRIRPVAIVHWERGIICNHLRWGGTKTGGRDQKNSRVEDSHPSDKKKNVARVGTQNIAGIYLPKR
jgi:hypothetical protein